MDKALQFSLEKLKYKNIKDNQRKVIENYMTGKDVLFCSPTGSGKSLTFEVASFMFGYITKEKRIVIVISPLTSLMKSQSAVLRQKGIRALCLKDDLSNNIEDGFEKMTISDPKDGDVNIIFASPESILNYQRDLILELSKQKLIKILFVDKAHCIKKCGKSDPKKKKPACRPSYVRLGEIRSLLGGGIPVVALTATSTKEVRDIILKDLCMENCTQIIINPDKKT